MSAADGAVSAADGAVSAADGAVSTEVEQLVDLSRAAGGDLLLVQGGGGNASVKSADGARMWIKASGFRLADVRPDRGHVTTDVAALLASVRDPSLAALPRAQAHEASVERVQAAARDGGRFRPSLETGFHAVLPRVVLHTHAVLVNAFTCMEGGERALAGALGDTVPIVAYEPPGYALAVAVDRAWRARRADAQLIALANHGLIAVGATPAEALAATRRAVAAAESFFGALEPDACAEGAPPPALVEWAARLTGRAAVVRPAKFAALLDAATTPDRWLRAGPLVPDDVVYSGRQVALADEHGTPGGRPIAPVIAVAGLGVVLTGASAAAVDATEETLLAHVLVRRLIARRGRPRALPAHEVDYLVAMESEHYRSAIAAGAVPGSGPCRS